MTNATMPAPPAIDHPRVRRDLTIHELDGEALLYDALTGDTHRLNATAWCVWQLCDGVRTAGDIAAALSERYQITAEAAQPHVETILSRFCERGLLQDAQSAALSADAAGSR